MIICWCAKCRVMYVSSLIPARLRQSKHQFSPSVFWKNIDRGEKYVKVLLLNSQYFFKKRFYYPEHYRAMGKISRELFEHSFISKFHLLCPLQS
jgi:hypothetical protein